MGVFGENDKNSKRSLHSLVRSKRKTVAANQVTQTNISLMVSTFITPKIKMNL